MKLRTMPYPYAYMPVEKRRGILPKHNVCSIAPAEDRSDSLYSGSGLYRIDVNGNPFADEITVTQEACYEPQWAKTPTPPDLRPYMDEIRRHVLDGEPEKADALIDKAQREAGMDKYMNLDAKIVYPAGSPHVHKAYTLTFARQEAGISDYLRFVDLYSGLVTTRWNQADGEYKNEYLAVYGDDLVAMRLTAPKGKLDLDIALDLPSKQGRYGRPAMVNSSNTLDKSAEMITVAWAYNPEYGKKGYAFALRFLLTGGESAVTEKGLCVKGADSLVILSKVAFYPKDFAFGCEEALAKALLSESGDFDAYIAKSRAVLGEKMGRSYLTLGKGEDYLLSGEELLRRSRNELFLDPELMDKLYDMGRFYQLIDTGSIPPMWGQHNINTNLQVCAGNNTGLFDEMDVYFRYYEDKFEDFRTNARLLYGARGLLASVHCDPDSGLYYHFSRTYPHYAWTGCLGWIYNEFWGYWLCTGDREFLRTRVVPALEEIALFFEDYACLKDENGKSIFVPSFSPEDPTPNPDYVTVTSKSINPTRINSVMDIAICREVLQNLITACNTLEIKQDRIAHWEAQLASLPDLLADEEGALKEWAWPTIEENYNHRHVSHHYDLWPGRAVTTDTEPEIAESIRISNRKRGQQDDSAHGIIHRTLCAIRLRDMEELEQDLTQLIGHGFVRRNLSTAHFPYRGQFPDLQGAMPAILIEMCVFSMPGVVEFLPALPDYFKSGSLDGIWLYTWAKLETLSWDEKGARAVLVSDRDQTLTLRMRKPCTMKIGGKAVAMDGDHVDYAFKKGEMTQIEIVF